MGRTVIVVLLRVLLWIFMEFVRDSVLSLDGLPIVLPFRLIIFVLFCFV